MTAFEKSLRALGGEALRAGAEELLALLAGADGIRTQRGDLRTGSGQKRRDVAAARVSALVADGASPEKRRGERSATSAAGAPAPDGAIPETARARRAYPETDNVGPAAEETARENGDTSPGPAFPGTAVGKGRRERKRRKSREEREARKAQDDREDREDRDAPENRNDAEKRREREEQVLPMQALRTGDGETVDREDTRSLEERLQSVSRQRRGRVQPSGEDGAHIAAFRGPERQYEGAVGARGTEMRRISDYFRRDSRRYDTGFTTY